MPQKFGKLISLLGLSTYETVNKSDRESIIKTRIINSYPDFVTRVYCRIRFHIINSRFLETIEQHLQPNVRVLDLGCGFGLFSNYLASHDTTREIHGIDLNTKRIEQAKTVANLLDIRNTHFMVGNAEDYTFDHAPFDVVIMLDILHHLDRESAEELLEAAFKHLKPDGIIIIKDVNVTPFWKMLFTYILDKIMDFKRPVHYRHAKVWKQVLQDIGWRDVLTYHLLDYLPYPHILVIGKKETADE